MLAVTFGAAAQERSIDFEEAPTWQEIVKIAREADRLIFVDCYTDWCGPCRRVVDEVFTVNEVADFFNDNFVNAKFEMEKNTDGPSLARKYGVTAFPTFLFINPHTEQAEYVKVGVDDHYQWLIDAGKEALSQDTDEPGMASEDEIVGGTELAGR